MRSISLWHIEDDEAQLALMRLLLREVSPTTRLEAFSTGKKALEALNRCSDKSDIVFLSDLNLPDISGLDLLSTIRNPPYSCPAPFIFLSGTESEEIKKEACARGANAFLVKPFELEDLKEILRDLIAFWSRS